MMKLGNSVPASIFQLVSEIPFSFFASACHVICLILNGIVLQHSQRDPVPTGNLPKRLRLV